MSHQWLPPFDPQTGETNTDVKALAVHIGLLPHGPAGSLVYFSGNRWDVTNHRTGAVDHTALFDYASRVTTRPGSPTGPGGLQPNHLLDVFCCGHALLADGRLLVAGGTSAMQIDAANPHNGHWGGLREAFAFDPNATSPWTTLGSMNTCPVPGYEGVGGGRWYPSLITLGDGSVLAVCGHPRVFGTAYDEVDPSMYPATEDDPRHNNNSPDRYRPSSNSWQQLSPDGLGEGYLHDFAVFYPRLHVLPSGKLLIVQPLYTDNAHGTNDPSEQWSYQSLVYDPDSQAVVAGFPGPQNIDPAYLNPGFAAQFTTSVLLPLRPGDNYQASVLVCGARPAARATIATGAESSASWTPTGARQAFFAEGGTNRVPVRANALATLLPTGQVLVTGGTDVWEDPGTIAGNAYDSTFAVRVPELYNPDTNSWTALTDAPATVARGYHSVALLMPDGRVLTAGSEVNNIFGQNNAEYRMEIFEPDYIALAGRPTITSAPPSLGYGEQRHLAVQLSSGHVSKVVATRFGSATHGFDYDQRYVELTFETAGSQLLVAGPPNGNVAPPGYYLLWVIDDQGRPCVQGATVRIGQQRLVAEFDRSTFSSYDVQLNQDPASHHTSYRRSFAAVFEGVIPAEVTGLHPTASFDQAGLSATLSASGPISNPALEDTSSPQLIQSVYFAFDLTFDHAVAFAGLAGPDALRTVTVTITAGDWQCTGQLELVLEPSPFMVDGDPSWLSDDLRVFQVTADNADQWLPGHTFSAPSGYLHDLINYLNGDPARGPAMFDALPTDEAAAAVTLLPTTTGAPDGPPVYNFAVARVRLDSATVPADYVRVLFRLFRTQQATLTYDTATLYRRAVLPIPPTGTELTEDALPLLGVQAGELVSIPFFAAPRVGPTGDMTAQPDPDNRQTIPAAGHEVVRYFACWLDINRPDQKQFPRHPGAAASFGSVPPGSLFSIQELITGTHQCLVAEVHYKLDPAAPELPRPGDSPATSDKLSQRNLALTTSANPGSAATRTICHSFSLGAPGSPARGASRAGKSRPGRLSLWWGDLPKQTTAELYLPGVASSDVLALVPAPWAPTLTALDRHTLGCGRDGLLGDRTVIPLPIQPRGLPMVGAITLRLPAGVKHGQRFSMHAAHVSDAGQLLGAFQLEVRVDADHAALLQADRDQLAILLHNRDRTPHDDRWRPVLDLLADELTTRVAAFGGKKVTASPWGAGPHPPIQVGPAGSGKPRRPDKRDGDDCRPATAVRLVGELIVPPGLTAELELRTTIRLSVEENRD